MWLIALATALSKLKTMIAALANGFHYKGSVNTPEDLPTDAEDGDLYTVSSTSGSYVWDGSAWVPTGIRGIQGPQGAQGPKGDDGAIHYTAGTRITISPQNSISANTEDIEQTLNNIKNLGRFLALWDCTTGLPTSEPWQGTPYAYRVGDYYRVSSVSESGTNYRPQGEYYTGDPSTTPETEPITTSAVYYYDGNNWLLQAAGSSGVMIEYH